MTIDANTKTDVVLAFLFIILFDRAKSYDQERSRSRCRRLKRHRSARVHGAARVARVARVAPRALVLSAIVVRRPWRHVVSAEPHHRRFGGRRRSLGLSVGTLSRPSAATDPAPPGVCGACASVGADPPPPPVCVGARAVDLGRQPWVARDPSGRPRHREAVHGAAPAARPGPSRLASRRRASRLLFLVRGSVSGASRLACRRASRPFRLREGRRRQVCVVEVAISIALVVRSTVGESSASCCAVIGAARPVDRPVVSSPRSFACRGMGSRPHLALFGRVSRVCRDTPVVVGRAPRRPVCASPTARTRGRTATNDACSALATPCGTRFATATTGFDDDALPSAAAVAEGLLGGGERVDAARPPRAARGEPRRGTVWRTVVVTRARPAGAVAAPLLLRRRRVTAPRGMG